MSIWQDWLKCPGMAPIAVHPHFFFRRIMEIHALPHQVTDEAHRNLLALWSKQLNLSSNKVLLSLHKHFSIMICKLFKLQLGILLLQTCLHVFCNGTFTLIPPCPVLSVRVSFSSAIHILQSHIKQAQHLIIKLAQVKQIHSQMGLKLQLD